MFYLVLFGGMLVVNILCALIEHAMDPNMGPGGRVAVRFGVMAVALLIGLATLAH